MTKERLKSKMMINIDIDDHRCQMNKVNISMILLQIIIIRYKPQLLPEWLAWN